MELKQEQLKSCIALLVQDLYSDNLNRIADTGNGIYEVWLDDGTVGSNMNQYVIASGTLPDIFTGLEKDWRSSNA